MKQFTSSPLTSQTLATRLCLYKFWSRESIDIVIAKNALVAAKTVARQRPVKSIPQAVQGVLLPQPDVHELLNKMYKHKPFIALLPILWREILLMEPIPTLETKKSLLRTLVHTRKQVSHEESINIIASVMKSEAIQNGFVSAANLLEVVPPKSILEVLRIPALFTGMATASIAIWLSSPLIALGLFTYWLGFVIISMRLPAYPHVLWNGYRYKSQISQLRRLDLLRLANMLVTAFEELGPPNVSNYHRKASLKFKDLSYREAEVQLISALRQHDIKMRTVSSTNEAYADYWSENALKWHTVEWCEPDQDPAEIELDLKRGTKEN